MANDIRVIVADDNDSFLEGLEVLLTAQGSYEIIGQFSNGLDLLNSKELPRAQLILLDIEMPIMNGLEAAMKINYVHPNIPMIALTMYLDKVFLNEIIRSGFKGFIHKPDTATKLMPAIDLVMDNKFVFPDNLKIV